MFIRDIDRLGCAMVCEKCDKIWRSQSQLNSHQKSCTGLCSRVRYSGGVYTPPTSVSEELSKLGMSIEEDYVFPYRATFDFVVYFNNNNNKILNGISNAHYHRNVPCSMRYINYYNLKA